MHLRLVVIGPASRRVQTWNNWCIEIDRSKRLKDDPGKGHNRWHPDITPILEVDPGEDVVLETRDASDGQMNANVTVDDFPGFAGKVGHPLTGPVYI